MQTDGYTSGVTTHTSFERVKKVSSVQSYGDSFRNYVRSDYDGYTQLKITNDGINESGGKDENIGRNTVKI